MNVLELYGQHYDFPQFVNQPMTSYMLAAIPRSGSTHLAMQLWKTGVMGAPMEYPNTPFMDPMRQRLGTGDDYVAYWDALKRVRTSCNGVFGYKMFVSDYVRSGNHYPELLHEIVPDKVVYLTRENLVEQAVSYAKAIRSGAWFHGVQERQKAVYDEEDIRLAIAALKYQMDFWDELFTLTKTEVHAITYEALLADPEKVIKRVANFLGVELDSAAAIALPSMGIQRDAESAEWVRRHKEDRAALDIAEAPSVAA